MTAAPTAIRVMLVDDHAVVRAGYGRLLELERDIAVVAEHADADSALDALLRTPDAVDVLLLDLSMSGRSGLDLLRRVVPRLPRLRVLVCSMHDNAAMVTQALRAGAAGFVTKSADPALLADAVRRVARMADVGRDAPVLSPDVAHATSDPAATAPHLALSAREFDIFQLLVMGWGTERIAAQLHLSPKTVANYQTLIRTKLGAGNAVELLRYAQQHRLFAP